jgi:hypothetical protein
VPSPLVIGYNDGMKGDTAHTILDRLISPSDGDLNPTVAEGILGLRFSESDHDRIQALATKNTEGNLNSEEQAEHEGYVLVGELLALMQAKARLSLRNHPSAA